MGVAAAIAVVTAASAVYTTEEQKRQSRLNRDAQRNQIESQKKDLLNRQEEENKIAQRDREKARKQALAASAGGRQSTILTSPLGVVEDANAKSKTVLGG